MIVSTDDNSYLLFFKHRPTRAEFIRHAQVSRNSHAEEMMRGIYDDVFVYSTELRRQYLSYYAIEYPKFSQFVDAFTWILDGLLHNMDRHFSRYDSIIPYQNVPEYLRDEDGLKLLSQLFSLRIHQ